MFDCKCHGTAEEAMRCIQSSGVHRKLFTQADLDGALESERARIHALVVRNSERDDLDALVRAVWSTLAAELRDGGKT